MKIVKAKLEFDTEAAQKILAEYAESHDMALPYPDWLYDRLHELIIVELSIDDTAEVCL